MATPSFLWDYDIDETDFQQILEGRKELGRLNRDWAAVRLLEHASYPEIVRFLGYRELIEGWPQWRSRIRSEGRRRGFDFLARWLPEHHPEVLTPKGQASRVAPDPLEAVRPAVHRQARGPVSPNPP